LGARPPGDTCVVEWRACAGDEDRVAVFCVVARVALLLERVEHPWCERDVAASVAAFGCVDAVVEPPPHVQPLRVDVDVAPAESDRFAEAQAGVSEELDEQPPILRDVAEQSNEFCFGEGFGGFLVGGAVGGAARDADAGGGVGADGPVWGCINSVRRPRSAGLRAKSTLRTPQGWDGRICNEGERLVPRFGSQSRVGSACLWLYRSPLRILRDMPQELGLASIQ
jgi:hypothetical protein